MRTKMRINTGILMLLLGTFVVLNANGQDTIPLVYDVEHTGVDCTMPPLPGFEELPVVEPLTDPFEWSDGSGRDTTFAAWTRRRTEIKEEIEHYEIGPKPVRPDTISAIMDGDTLKITVTENGETLHLSSVIYVPDGEGPFPAVIGISPFEGVSSIGFILSGVFNDQPIAQIEFNFWQVMAWQQGRGNEPINALYTDLAYAGAYSAWSWGVSRLIDGLELVSEEIPVDLSRLAITGCSFAGKMALFAGAYDERIALTIPQESGGGGAAAWRVTEALQWVEVETLGNTSRLWFMESMFQFSGNNVSKLPHDHHELMAMVAPRALFVIGNPSQEWLAEESGYTSCAAAKKVWENFGISDRMGYSFVTDHPHCQLPEVQWPEVLAFTDRFLLGDTTANTNITTNEYDYVIPEYWTDWWGKGDPYFPVLDRGDAAEVWYEAECGTVGAAWNVRLDTAASNGSYVVVKDGLNNTSAPADSGAAIYYTINIPEDNTYYIAARLNCPTHSNDGLWLRVDDENFRHAYSLKTEGWEWKNLVKKELTAGEHTLAVAFREEGLQMDKLVITTFYYPAGEKGEAAEFLCDPDTTTRPYTVPASLKETTHLNEGYFLHQNFPNPITDATTISFEIP